MSDRPTPETDAAEFYYDGKTGFVEIAFCRKLERERDEARARVELITPLKNDPVAEYFSSPSTPETDAAVKESNGQWSFVLKETCQRLECERDEAREKYTTLLTENMLEVHRLYKELDNAIAVADELAAIASLCLGWTLSNIKSSTDEANLAQADKIIRAIEHWKKLKMETNKQETN